MRWAHPEWTADRLEAFWAVTAAADLGPVAVREEFVRLPEAHKLWAVETMAAGRVPLLAASAFALPVMSSEACAYLIERSGSFPWTENREEGEAVRIPEAVLEDVDPALCREVMAALMATLAPWFAIIWGKLPADMKSIQMARYNPSDRSSGNWHCDRDSNFTAVISLDPTAFEGGGTELADGAMGSRIVPPLPVGYALVFDGRRVLHQGLPVISGDRRLLVIWANDIEEPTPLVNARRGDQP